MVVGRHHLSSGNGSSGNNHRVVTGRMPAHHTAFGRRHQRAVNLPGVLGSAGIIRLAFNKAHLAPASPASGPSHRTHVSGRRPVLPNAVLATGSFITVNGQVLPAALEQMPRVTMAYQNLHKKVESGKQGAPRMPEQALQGRHHQTMPIPLGVLHYRAPAS